MALTDRIYRIESWCHLPWEEIKKGIPNYLGRAISDKEGRTQYLSEAGYETLRELVDCLYESEMHGDRAGYGDYYNACRDMLVECMSRNLRPDSGEEVAEYVWEHINEHIEKRFYAVPLLGLDLKGVDRLQLGNFSVRTPSTDVLTEFGVKYKADDAEWMVKRHKDYLWLIGAAIGTSPVAFHKFQMAADQLTGFLSMYVGSVFERGGIRFAFRAATSAEELPTTSTWLSWSDEDKSMWSSRKPIKSQYLEVDADRVNEFEGTPFLQYCFSLPLKSEPTELEAALLRAAIWLDDAAHERRFAMRLLKLWSCAEIFFSANANTSKTVCEGVVDALAYGPEPFLKGSEEVSDTFAALKNLYNKRSRATHGGLHSHVLQTDCEKLSQWISWMMINMCALSFRRFPTVEVARDLLKRVGAIANSTES